MWSVAKRSAAVKHKAARVTRQPASESDAVVDDVLEQALLSALVQRYRKVVKDVKPGAPRPRHWKPIKGPWARVIEKFGSVRRVAQILEENEYTVGHWAKSETMPSAMARIKVRALFVAMNLHSPV